jgi:hypothetical protein
MAANRGPECDFNSCRNLLGRWQAAEREVAENCRLRILIYAVFTYCNCALLICFFRSAGIVGRPSNAYVPIPR